MATELHTEVSTFQRETTAALAGVRGALSALTKAISVEIQRPTDLQKKLKVDYKLSWQIFNLVNESNLMAAARLVPGSPSLQRLIRAARNKGVSAETTEAVKQAIDAFERVVKRHAEDRAEFDLMASVVASPAAAAAAELMYRKGAFRNDSHIWGVSTDVACATTIIRRSANDLSTDECSIVNRWGCRRYRPDATLSVFAYRNYGADGAPPGKERIPLDHDAAERYGAHILPRFCSQPIPAFKTWLRPDGYTAVDVESREIGRQTAINLVSGQIFRGCPFTKDLSGNPYYQADRRITGPIRLLVSFLLVHRPSFGLIKPELLVFRQSQGDESATVAHSSPQVPTREEIQYLGTGRVAWQIPDIHTHDEQVQLALDELGWNPMEFDVFRIRIEYPVLHSVVRMGFPLLKQ